MECHGRPALNSVSVVWFRDDLRIADNPALTAAINRGSSVLALYVLDEESPGIRPLGGASQWWLHESLLSLEQSLSELNISLVLRKGAAGSVVPDVVRDSGATSLFWNRRYGAGEIAVDAELKQGLRSEGVHVESFQASLLFEPWTIRTGQGSPYSVFTPFWRECRNNAEALRLPLPTPPRCNLPAPALGSESIATWALQPTSPDWAEGLRRTWAPGESHAHERLHEFLEGDLEAYSVGRDVPAERATSGLSPHLRWGELSAHQVWHEVQQIRAHLSPIASEGATKFLTEIGWREFAWHVLFHFPNLSESNWRPEFNDFPWRRAHPDELAAWQRGTTGYPMVDAGMRELWETGTMHNRVRMVAASFLTKNLLIDWRVGEQWFWDTLVDADQASNPFNWQWVAGSGVDAAPYFRVFNPELQAKKFDPRETYIRHHIPEWGSDKYPQPIVALDESRSAALAAYQSIKRQIR